MFPRSNTGWQKRDNQSMHFVIKFPGQTYIFGLNDHTIG